MAAKLLRKMAITAKIETVRGQDALPAGLVDAMLVSDVTLTPIEGDVVERDVIRPYFGAGGSTMVTEYSKVAFAVEAAGVAAAGDLPGYAALMRGSAMSVTVDTGVDVSFAPVTDGIESLTIYGNVDGVLHKMTDAHGNVRLVVDAKGIPKWQFEFTGSFIPATDTPLPSVSYAEFMPPLGVNKRNSTLSIDGYNAACSSFSFDAGNNVVKRDVMNVDSVEITGRNSTGSVTFENTSVATKNWVAMAQASAQVPIHLVHGRGLTNVVEFHSLTAQVGKPTYGESDGVQMITVPLSFIPTSAGNDEWSIVVR